MTNASTAQPHVMTTYGRLPIALTHGKGCRAWDTEGREYLDALDAIPHDIDLAAQLPHGALRLFVMGDRGAAGESDERQLASAVERGDRQQVEHREVQVDEHREPEHAADVLGEVVVGLRDRDHRGQLLDLDVGAAVEQAPQRGEGGLDDA